MLQLQYCNTGMLDIFCILNKWFLKSAQTFLNSVTSSLKLYPSDQSVTNPNACLVKNTGFHYCLFLLAEVLLMKGHLLEDMRGLPIFSCQLSFSFTYSFKRDCLHYSRVGGRLQLCYLLDVYHLCAMYLKYSDLGNGSINKQQPTSQGY